MGEYFLWLSAYASFRTCVRLGHIVYHSICASERRHAGKIFITLGEVPASGFVNQVDYAPASCTQQQTTIATVPSDANLTGLAWTPDDSGLLLVHSGQGSISYADRAADTVTTVISEPGRYFGSVAVDQHWNVFVTSIVDATPYLYRFKTYRMVSDLRLVRSANAAR